MITIAVDCMGGDHGPQVTLVACRQFLSAHPDAQLIVVGLPQAMAAWTPAVFASLIGLGGLFHLEDG